MTRYMACSGICLRPRTTRWLSITVVENSANEGVVGASTTPSVLLMRSFCLQERGLLQIRSPGAFRRSFQEVSPRLGILYQRNSVPTA